MSQAEKGDFKSKNENEKEELIEDMCLRVIQWNDAPFQICKSLIILSFKNLVFQLMYFIK